MRRKGSDISQKPNSRLQKIRLFKSSSPSVPLSNKGDDTFKRHEEQDCRNK
jgi:hypothetical protein